MVLSLTYRLLQVLKEAPEARRHFISTLISLIILYGLRHLKKIFAHDLFTMLTLSYHGVENPLDQIKQILEDHQLIIQFINYNLEPASNVQTYRLRLQSKNTISVKGLLSSLSKTAGLQELNWQEGEVP